MVSLQEQFSPLWENLVPLQHACPPLHFEKADAEGMKQ